jgi:hypothetical protein
LLCWYKITSADAAVPPLRLLRSMCVVKASKASTKLQILTVMGRSGGSEACVRSVLMHLLSKPLCCP